MDLIERSQAGDEEAFASLFHEYKNLVYKTAVLMLGNAEEAEDALQEVFIRVYESLSTYDPSKGAFTTWLHQITVNYCLNRLRRRRVQLPLDTVSSIIRTWARAPFARRWTEREAIQEALDQLSDKLRATVVLRYYWDLSYAEIAEIMDIPLGTVKSRLYQAHRRLREELEMTPVVGRTEGSALVE